MAGHVLARFTTADNLPPYREKPNAQTSFNFALHSCIQPSHHHEERLTWAVATLKEEAVTAAGKHELGTFRWTVIFQKQDGKWLIVHEHTSVPLQ